MTPHTPVMELKQGTVFAWCGMLDWSASGEMRDGIRDRQCPLCRSTIYFSQWWVETILLRQSLQRRLSAKLRIPAANLRALRERREIQLTERQRAIMNTAQREMGE